MSQLNQSAPPVEVKATANYFRFDPLPKSDTYVFTLVGYNYLESTPFNRTDEKTKAKTVVNGQGIEWFLGTMVDGKPYFVKTWPVFYSISDRANYSKWYKAMTGALPTPAQRPDDCLGKGVLVPVELVDKVSSKGTKYKATKVGAPSAVPSILAATVTKLKDLDKPFKEALAKSDQSATGGKADAGDDEDSPF